MSVKGCDDNHSPKNLAILDKFWKWTNSIEIFQNFSSFNFSFESHYKHFLQTFSSTTAGDFWKAKKVSKTEHCLHLSPFGNIHEFPCHASAAFRLGKYFIFHYWQTKKFFLIFFFLSLNNKKILCPSFTNVCFHFVSCIFFFGFLNKGRHKGNHVVASWVRLRENVCLNISRLMMKLQCSTILKVPSLHALSIIITICKNILWKFFEHHLHTKTQIVARPQNLASHHNLILKCVT